jgi:hypothetical protein
MSEERGRINHKQAYAQGKMLNHAAWNAILPRGITPSDVDFFFDNKGQAILCELSSSASNWHELTIGQRLGYWNLIRGTRHIAVLCKHSVSSQYEINTYADIEAFSVMYDLNGTLTTTPIYKGVKAWQHMVDKWFNRSPEWVKERLPPPAPEDVLVDWYHVLARETEETEDAPINFIQQVLAEFGGEVTATKDDYR